MSKIVISPGISIKRGAVEFNCPKLEIDMPSPGDVSERAAARIRERLVALLSRGNDADGVHHTLAASTIKRRLGDMRPPRTNTAPPKWKMTTKREFFSKKTGARTRIVSEWRARGFGKRRITTHYRALKSGEVKKRTVVKIGKHTNRWQARFGVGGGSEGGAVAFVDSGHLTRAMYTRRTGDTATVVAPDRGAGVAIMERTGTPIMTVTADVLEEALAAELSLMLNDDQRREAERRWPRAHWPR